MKGNFITFASSGSCFDDELVIIGEVENVTFTSFLFSGTMNSQNFWDRLSVFAKGIKKFVVLKYIA